MLRLLYYRVTLLLALLCVLSVHSMRGDRLAVHLLRAAIQKHDMTATRQLLRSGLITAADVSEAPTPLYWAASERADSKDLASIVQLLLESFGKSNYDYGRFHPLTRAVVGDLQRVTEVLLRWPHTIPEVLAAYMGCEDLAAVPSTVTVVVSDDTAQCFRDFPRIVSWEQSRLAAAQRQWSKEVNVQAEHDWSNPFLQPPGKQKPPTGQLIVNPLAFADFTEAVTYYLLGEWPPMIAVTYDVLVTIFWILTCVIFITSTMR